MQKSVQFNSDFNPKDVRDFTGFHYACLYGCSKVAEMIIQKKHEIGWTPFQFACGKGLTNIAEMLMQKFAKHDIDLNPKIYWSPTIFHHACQYNDYLDVTTMLMQKSFQLTPLSLNLAKKKKSFKTKALYHVFIWCLDTLNPENEKQSISLF